MAVASGGHLGEKLFHQVVEGEISDLTTHQNIAVGPKTMIYTLSIKYKLFSVLVDKILYIIAQDVELALLSAGAGWCISAGRRGGAGPAGRAAVTAA